MIKKALLFSLLAAASAPTQAADPLTDYYTGVKLIRQASAIGNLSPAQERKAMKDLGDLYKARIDHPWTWWFYVDLDFSRPGSHHSPGTLLYDPYPVIKLKSWAFDSNDDLLTTLPSELTDSQFATVHYEVSYIDDIWSDIGDSSDPNGYFQLNYNATGFEPIFRATLFDASGNAIHKFDANGYDVTTAISMAIRVPEPSEWAMLVVGFGLVGGLVRAKRAAEQRATARS